MWLVAIRVKIAPGNGVVLNTLSPVAATDKLRVVGIPSDSIPSLMIYSRIIGPSAARPSPLRE